MSNGINNSIADISQVSINVSLSERVKWDDELFSTLTLEECEARFQEHYENNYHNFSGVKEKLSLLRSCIELLERLGSTNLHQFAGRVLIFLARVLPLLDQSGLNFRSEFSNKKLPASVVERLNQINNHKSNNEKDPSQIIDNDMEEGETISDDESNETAPQDDKDKIFERFWNIQRLLNQPNSLFDKNNYYTFRTCIDSLLGKMESKPAHLRVWNLRSRYMCDPKSLSLQLNDISMRRCVLVQILITIQYLDMPLESKPENFTLDKIQQAWLSTVTKRIYALLESMPNSEEGRRFLSLVKHIFRREEMWSKWMSDKCKDVKRPADADEIVNMRGTYHKRRKISDEIRNARSLNMLVIGSQDMTRLWNMKSSEKFNTPELDQYLSIPEEKQAESFKDPNYNFRVIRLLRKSPHFFGQSSAPIVSLEDYLKIIASRFVNKSKT